MEHTGVLLVRIWVEDGPSGLRARIIGRPDLDRPEQTVAVATTPDEIGTLVARWAEAFLLLRADDPPS